MTAAGPSWHVVETHPHAEAKAAAHLERQGYATYLPRYLRERRHARRVAIVPAPLFPRYLFVAIDMRTQRWRAIKSTIGVARLVCARSRHREFRVWERRGKAGKAPYANSWSHTGRVPSTMASSNYTSRDVKSGLNRIDCGVPIGDAPVIPRSPLHRRPGLSTGGSNRCAAGFYRHAVPLRVLCADETCEYVAIESTGKHFLSGTALATGK
jgi:hypothetical protein